MALHDTRERYGTVSRLFHWGIALLLAWQFGGMIYKEVVGRSPFTAFWVGSHVSIGTLLLVLILGRLWWALAHRRSRPPYPDGLVGRAAKAGHVLLYALMAVIPSLAFLRMLGGERPISLFGVLLRGPRQEEIEWMVAPANLLHGKLAWVLLVLIVGHIAMALLHRFVWRDDTLSRMAGSGGRQVGPEPIP